MNPRPYLAAILLAAVFGWLAPLPVRALSVADYTVQVSARVQTSPPQITLSWPADVDALTYTAYRKARNDTTWGTGIVLATNATSYVDANVAVGQTYEYRIVKSAREGTTGYSGYGYIYAGIEAPLVEDRGKVVLLVESTYAAALSNELFRLEMDLAGDGWTVLRHNVWRTNTPPQIKALITADYYADPANVKSVFLFGRVPVPYSGSLCPDGHGDHCGAWAADVYYADMDGTWTDSSINSTNASRPENRNAPGDGKFDQTTPLSNFELQVGRVDMANLSSFPEGEQELLRRYLNKHHQFRLGYFNPPRRGIVDDHFGTFGGEAFAGNGYRNFAPFFGATNIFAKPWFSTLATNSYLWGHACGGGSYTSESGVGVTADFARTNTQVVFTMHFGSYFGDYDSANNLMRAQLANAGGGLTCAWAGRPHWQFHHMGLGETVGFSALMTENHNGSLYTGYRSVHVNLLGDPTLRMHVVLPPSGLVVTPGAGTRELRWQASPDTVAGYHVYGAAAPSGPFQRLNASLVTGTNFQDAAALSSLYLVKAVKLESGGSGTYYNTSQGIYENLAGTFSPPNLVLTGPTNGTILSLPDRVPLQVSAWDLNRDLRQVDYYTNGVLLGSAIQWPFSLDLVQPWLGNYALTAIARDQSGLAATSTVANLTITYAIATLLPGGSTWKYYDGMNDLGTAWRAPEYDDSAWTNGRAQLGFGDGDATEITKLDTNRTRITTYFRTPFYVDPSNNFLALTVRLLRDDGGVVYLNGTEVFRSNMPTNQAILWATQASGNAQAADETIQFYDGPVPLGLLRPGTNYLAAEIHQYGNNSSDLSFDLALLATNRPATMNTAPSLTAPSGQATLEDVPTAPIAFTVRDAESWPEGLAVSAWSANTNLLPAASFTFSGTGSNRFLVITPAPNQSGSASVTLAVADLFTNATATFSLTVDPVADAPLVSLVGLTNGSLLSGARPTLAASVFDPETNALFVEFFVNQARLGQAASPFSLAWSNAAPGYYWLGARATDSTGLTGESSPVFVSHLGAALALAPTGFVWKFYDLGADLGTAWTGTNYNDSAWGQGPAPLGYGDANGQLPRTTNGWGPVSTNKYLTTYYRQRFVVADPAAWTNLQLQVQRDDGLVVYLNEVEVFRNNLPTGAVTYLTKASSAIGTTNETLWLGQALAGSRLLPGTNVLAVEVHQSDGTSSDLWFNLELLANQTLTPPSVTVSPAAGALQFGWPEWAGGLSLWQATNLASPPVWWPVTNAPLRTNGQMLLSVPADQPRGLFQLRSQ